MNSGSTVTLSRRASRGERQFSLALVMTLLLASLVTVALHGGAVVVFPSFIPLFVGSSGMADALAAGLLFSLYRMTGQQTVLYAACAYLLNTLLIIPYGLTFPGVIDAHGFIGNVQSAAWLWVVWHVAFAAIILLGDAKRETVDFARRKTAMRNAIGWMVVAAAVAAMGVTLGRHWLPMLLRGRQFTPLFAVLAVGASTVSLVGAAVLLRARRLSKLRLWLVVALATSALDTALNVIAPSRYSASWYVGKAEQFVTSSIVLVSMLAAWSAIHARSTALAQRLALALSQRRALQIQFDREHRASKAFQQAALPGTLPVVPGLSFAAVYRAANADAFIGGDWYDAFRLTDGRVVLSVGDVMGSGLNAAVTMNAVRQAVRGAAQILPDPLAVLDAADRVLRSERPDAIVTALVALFDPVTLTLTYSSAGHPPALLRDAAGGVTLLGNSGLPLGLRSPLEGLVEAAQTIELPDPSLLVLYTDGLTEAHHDPVQGELQLRSFLAHFSVCASSDPATEIANALLDEPRDDVAILTMRLDGVLHLRGGEHAGARWTLNPREAQRARTVRAQLARALTAAGATSDQVVVTELIYSELLGNVVRHCQSDVDIALDVSTFSPVLHVLDRGPGFAYSARLPTSMLSESGRGLFIVSALTHDFNVGQRAGGGSHARAVLPFVLHPPDAYAAGGRNIHAESSQTG